MLDDAKRFRNRATDCRALAKSARSEIDAVMLEDIAAELEEEADRIEAGKAKREGA
jgi:hypothetical protein